MFCLALLVAFLPLSVARVPIYCVAKCVADCATDACVSACNALKDESCALKIGDAYDLIVDELTFVHTTPKTVKVSWKSKANTTYVVKYRDHDLEKTPWMFFQKVFWTQTVVEITKKMECQHLYVEVTPVNAEGVGNPAKLDIDEPVLPEDQMPEFEITDRQFVSNETNLFQVTFHYNITPVWRHMVKSISGISTTPQCNINGKLTYFPNNDSIRVDHVVSDRYKHRACTMVLQLESYVMCQRSVEMNIDPYTYLLDCADFDGCEEKMVCNPATETFCQLNYTPGNLSRDSTCADRGNITIFWEEHQKKKSEIFNDIYRGCNIHFYAMNFTIVNSTMDIVSSQFHQFPADKKSFELYNVPADGKIVVFGCELFKDPNDIPTIDDQLQNAVVFRHTLDDDACKNTGKLTKNNSILIAVPLSVTLFVVMVVAILVFRKSQNQRAKLRKMQSSLYNGKYDPRPEINDKWEIDNRCLQIFENEILGKGAFGKVYKGRIIGKAITSVLATSNMAVEQEAAENLIVAVKVCHEIADDLTKREFRMEIELMKSLYSHPRLVNILYCVTKVEPLSLVVEFCEKGDLLNYLRHTIRKYMKELEEQDIDADSDEVDTSRVMCYKDVLSVCFQVADGMAYISQKGYVHRDLAARNVLVCDSLQNVKIGDFGLCRTLAADTYVTKGGKLPMKWLALEAIERYEFSHPSDVWAFGIFIYEVLTLGDAPYPEILPEGDMRQTMLNFLGGGQRMAKPANCTDELYQIMSDTWLDEPSDRPDFVAVKEILRKHLEQLVQDETGYYGDYYITPNRNYYNDSVIDEQEMLSLPSERASTDTDTDKLSVTDERPASRTNRIPSRNSGPLIVEEEHTV